MQPRFSIERERTDRLYFCEYTNDYGNFHFHSPIELYFVDGGEMDVWINDKYKRLTAGEMSVSLSYDAHAYGTPESSSSSVLIIPPRICEEFIAATKNKRVTNPFICDKEAVSAIKACVREIKKGSSNDIKTLGYLYVILGTVMECTELATADEPIDTALSSKILFYINENFKNDVSLSALSAHFGYSQSYLSKYFKSCFRIGINDYISVIRLKNAVLLMREKKYSITYCALESGFNSVRTFYRAFETEFACSPKEYLRTL